MTFVIILFVIILFFCIIGYFLIKYWIKFVNFIFRPIEKKLEQYQEKINIRDSDEKRKSYDLNHQYNTGKTHRSDQLSREYNLKQKEVELKNKEADLLNKEQDLHHENLLKEKSNRINKIHNLGNKLYYKSKKINITGLYIQINTDKYLFENYFHAKSIRYIDYSLNITRFTLLGMASWCLIIWFIITFFLPSAVYFSAISLMLGLLLIIFGLFKKLFIIIYKGFRFFIFPKSILIMEGKENDIEIFEGYRFKIKKVEKTVNMAMDSYPNDLEKQEHVYNEQVESREFMLKALDKELIEFSKRKYPNDYSLQEYTYKEQLKSKSFMKKVTDKSIKEYAIAEYPEDYSMQEYIYNEQMALPRNERVKIEIDETIIDVNKQTLDLSVEKSEIYSSSNQEPPYWGHTYVYSYDEIKHATKAQKQYYIYFKNQVLKGEYVDIQGNTNYAFILYFDLLNEYKNHRNVEFLDEKFKLLGEICPKTRSYSLMSIQDLLRNRTDSYSVDKLTTLQEPNYQFEHGYSDYNPDAYKLGKQYKDKLELNKQEVAWLNKFWNPSNVFISIEGCCIATMKQYLRIIKHLNKKLKNKNTSVTKEVDFFKEKIFEIKEIVDSHWGVYDKSYLKQRVESEIYLAIFKRVENSVRESFGHKRKVGITPYYDFKGEFEIRIGNYVDELLLKYQNDIEHPDLDTQIELNAQNVNRWKIDFNKLKNSFQKEDKIRFIDDIINLEETNQKNPNIENIFFEASKFISKFDNVQSLKYYAKYIYYDLKSKKFDNKELTKTVQKSLFKTDEQINDFKRIIAELIESSDIKKALDEIAKIYIPKRKKIKLDKSVIKEVEQKHDGTVELLSEYLETEDKETVEIENENEEIGISVIPTNTNNTIFISEISIGKTQEELIKKIIFNSFKIHQNEVDKFATENGFFKNQLIDSINEACEEHLDGEALIEEDDENYVIEESYYKEIAL